MVFDEWFDFAKIQIKRFRRVPVSEMEVLLLYADTIQARGCNSIWEPSTPPGADRLATQTLNFMDFLDDENAEETMETRLFYASCFPSHGRRFGITERGFFCLVPNEAKRGDLVCIPHGNKVPLVFRKADDRFRNLGECYVNGLMTGEAAVLDGCREMVLEVV
jgi:hypothetical protein